MGDVEMFDGPVIDRDVIQCAPNNIPFRRRSRVPYFFAVRTPTLRDAGGVWRFDWHEQRRGWLLTRFEKSATWDKPDSHSSVNKSS
jgi:hypothetical protein